MPDIEMDRGCTDCLWLPIFGIFWVGMVVIAIIGFSMGKPNKLIYAVSNCFAIFFWWQQHVLIPSVCNVYVSFSPLNNIPRPPNNTTFFFLIGRRFIFLFYSSQKYIYTSHVPSQLSTLPLVATDGQHGSCLRRYSQSRQIACRLPSSHGRHV